MKSFLCEAADSQAHLALGKVAATPDDASRARPAAAFDTQPDEAPDAQAYPAGAFEHEPHAACTDVFGHPHFSASDWSAGAAVERCHHARHVMDHVEAML